MKSKCWFLSFLLLAPAVHAAVSERDWKTPGDGLLTFDDVNNREWLDFEETFPSNFPGLSSEQRYQEVVAETAPGGIFEGFVPARISDVIVFAQSAGIDTTTLDFTTNEASTQHLIELLGTNSAPQFNQFALALLDELPNAGTPGRHSIFFRVLRQSPPSSQEAGLGFGVFTTGDRLTPGVMLYRQIPEPSTVILFASTTLSVLGMRRR